MARTSGESAHVPAQARVALARDVVHQLMIIRVHSSLPFGRWCRAKRRHSFPHTLDRRVQRIAQWQRIWYCPSMPQLKLPEGGLSVLDARHPPWLNCPILRRMGNTLITNTHTITHKIGVITQRSVSIRKIVWGVFFVSMVFKMSKECP